MIRKLRFTLGFISYVIRAKSRFRVHSPFVYKFYTDVILRKESNEVFDRIEYLRRSLLRQRSLLETTDFGTGASGNAYKTRFRQVKHVTRYSSIGPRYGRLLHRLTTFASPAEILEIGTAMGISTMYIASAAPGSHLVTMEGCAVIAEKAHENFISMGLENIEVDLGNFDQLLGKSLDRFPKLDLVFIDGNHKKESTLKYFKQILPKLHENSILVIDDIHWSQGMEQAWKEITRSNKVSISIDIYKMGILLFRKEIAKEDFVLKF
ncbi:MAG TPA: class I SAM-dependent methyltransferase [Bacteroidales bacterium]|nr:class I SAM-dependent methyltransferase [Bacteroidales bacterium]